MQNKEAWLMHLKKKTTINAENEGAAELIPFDL